MDKQASSKLLSTPARKWYQKYRSQGFKREIAIKKAITHMDVPPHLKALVEKDPPKGQPGATDDPFVQNLLLAEVRRYRRFLLEGYNQETALKYALRFNRKPLDNFKTENIKNTTTTWPSQILNDNNKQNLVFRESIRLAALPKGYPNNMLPSDELESIRNLLNTMIQTENIIKLQFNGIYRKDGLLLIDCINHTTAEWIEKMIPKLSDSKGDSLHACLEFEIPQSHIIKMLLPNSAGQDVEKTLSLISNQNEGIDTRKWKVINYTDLKNVQLLNVRIDQQTIAAIKNNENYIAYKLSRVKIRGLTYLRTADATKS